MLRLIKNKPRRIAERRKSEAADGGLALRGRHFKRYDLAIADLGTGSGTSTATTARGIWVVPGRGTDSLSRFGCIPNEEPAARRSGTAGLPARKGRVD